MAITIQDYQYVRNTLPTEQSGIRNDVLQFGDMVTNLLPPINETSVIPLYVEGTKNKWSYTDRSASVQKGNLVIEVALEKNTTYVLQVINDTYPKDITDKNTITLNSTSIDFSEYIYFQTSSSDNNTCKLSINGVTFGYGLSESLYPDLELRSFKSPLEAKVFLFKATLPWCVNSNGIINTIYPTKIQSFATSSTLAIGAEAYTEAELSALYKEAPQIEIDADGNLKLSIASTINTTKWKKSEVTWKNRICLFVFKDTLKESSRSYKTCDGVVHNETTRYSLVRSIQNTRKNESDSYFKEVTIDDLKQINMVAGDSVTTPLLSYIFNKNTTAKFEDGSSNLSETISLGHMVCLGSNKKYCAENNIENRFDYTSVAFAWGYFDSNFTTSTVLSDYSVPLILSRNQTLSNNTITPSGSFQHNTALSYYNAEHYYFG